MSRGQILGSETAGQRGRELQPPDVHTVATVGCIMLVVVATVVSVWLRLRVPVPVGLSGVDDMLFVRLARALGDGQWLGPYTDVTLAKGPSYPVLLAVTNAVGVPVKAAEQVTYLLACAVVAAAAHLVLRRLVLTTGVYVVLALNPVSFTYESAQLLRDSWYGSLTLLLVAGTFVTAWLATHLVRRRWVAAAAVALGLVGATFWLCREEGASILPALLVVAAGVPLVGPMVGTGRWQRAVLPLAAAAVGFVIPVAGVALLNQHYYGVTATNDFASGSFAQAMAAWTRVDGGSPLPQVPLTAHQRELTYAVSPAAAELRPYLESATAPYAQLSCKAADCDYPGALLPWQVRLAAADGGHMGSAAETQRYFAELRDQIVDGCDTGALQCAKALPAPVQSLTRTPPSALAAAAGAVTRDTLTSSDLLKPGTTYWPDPLHARVGTAPVLRGIPATADEAREQAEDFAAHSAPYDVLAATYRVIVPVGAAIGVIVLLTGWWWVRRPARPLLVLLAGLATAYLGRTAVLSIVQVADFDTALPRYEIAGQMLTLAFGLVAAAVTADALTTRRSARYERSSPSA